MLVFIMTRFLFWIYVLEYEQYKHQVYQFENQNYLNPGDSLYI